MTHKISNTQILRAIENIPERERRAVSVDAVRICFEWFDAQRKTKQINPLPRLSKHAIERWCGCLITEPSVEVAARLHPEIKGNQYPNFNISRCLVRPHTRRLRKIKSANQHVNYTAQQSPGEYFCDES